MRTERASRFERHNNRWIVKMVAQQGCNFCWKKRLFWVKPEHSLEHGFAKKITAQNFRQEKPERNGENSVKGLVNTLINRRHHISLWFWGLKIQFWLEHRVWSCKITITIEICRAPLVWSQRLIDLCVASCSTCTCSPFELVDVSNTLGSGAVVDITRA